MSKIIKDSSLAQLVNNDNKSSTLNEFMTFKESFSPYLLKNIMNRYSIKGKVNIFEPFLGTGSIFLDPCICECYGEDVNPLSLEITKAKLLNINIEEAQNFIDHLKTISIPSNKYDYPNWDPYKKYAPYERFNFIKNYISIFEGTSFYDFSKMVIICNLDKLFDYKRDGNGIKYRKSKIKDSELRTWLDSLTINALNAKISYQKKSPNKTPHLFLKSSTIFNEKIKENVDIVVTSPPYCNMFDYFEVYKMELWTLEIVKNSMEMKKLKKTALRSNYNAEINNDYVNTKTLERCIEKLSLAGCKQKTINMIKNYFYDMNMVIKNIYKYLKNNSYLCIVVGNSFYNTKPIITDEIISEIGINNGFKNIEIIVARKLSTSSQQMKLISDNEHQFLRESIVVLKKVNNYGKKK